MIARLLAWLYCRLWLWPALVRYDALRIARSLRHLSSSALWAAYCAAQALFEQYLMRAHNRGHSAAIACAAKV